MYVSIKHFYKLWVAHHGVISRIKGNKIFKTGPGLKIGSYYCYCGYYHNYYYCYCHCSFVTWHWKAGRVDISNGGSCRWMDTRPEMQPNSPTTHTTQCDKWMFSGYLQSRSQHVVPTSFVGANARLDHFKGSRLNWWVSEQPCYLITVLFYLITKWPEQQRYTDRKCAAPKVTANGP